MLPPSITNNLLLANPVGDGAHDVPQTTNIILAPPTKKQSGRLNAFRFFYC